MTISAPSGIPARLIAQYVLDEFNAYPGRDWPQATAAFTSPRTYNARLKLDFGPLPPQGRIAIRPEAQAGSAVHWLNGGFRTRRLAWEYRLKSLKLYAGRETNLTAVAILTLAEL